MNTVFLLTCAIQHLLHNIITQLLDRHVQAKAMLVSYRGEALHVPRFGIKAVKGTDRSLGNRQIGVKDELRVNLQACAQACANRTRPLRRVETKEPRLKLGDILAWVIHTGIALTIRRDLATRGIQHLHNPTGELQRLLNRLRDAAHHRWRHHNTIDHQLNIMLIALL